MALYSTITGAEFLDLLSPNMDIAVRLIRWREASTLHLFKNWVLYSASVWSARELSSP